MPPKILLVEDDPMIASGLVYTLEENGYTVQHYTTVQTAIHTIKSQGQASPFNLAILDMQLPDGTGFDVAAALEHTGTAVIFLTVVEDEGNIVRAFDGGAEDYITKPFRLYEFLARVRRALQKPTHGAAKTLAVGQGITLDTLGGKVYLHGNLIELTTIEYRLLLTFAQNRGQLLSRSQILEKIWDASGNFVEDNTLTVYIKRLREKLGDALNIQTVRGSGYRVD